MTPLNPLNPIICKIFTPFLISNKRDSKLMYMRGDCATPHPIFWIGKCGLTREKINFDLWWKMLFKCYVQNLMIYRVSGIKTGGNPLMRDTSPHRNSLKQIYKSKKTAWFSEWKTFFQFSVLVIACYRSDKFLIQRIPCRILGITW